MHNDRQVSVCSRLLSLLLCDVSLFVLIVSKVKLVNDGQSVVVSHHLSFNILI